MKISALLLLLCLLMNTAIAVEVELAQGKIVINKPNTWSFMSVAESIEFTKRENPAISESELQRIHSGKLGMLLKYPEPINRYNPNLIFRLLPQESFKGRSSIDILRQLVAAWGNAPKENSVIKEIAEEKFGNYPGSSITIQYSFVRDGAEYSVRSKIIIIAAGDQLLHITQSALVEEYAEEEKEFAAILRSLKIE